MDKKNKSDSYRIDQYLNNQFNKLPETFDPADWNGVEAMLDKGKKKNVLWWYFLLPAFIIIAGICTYIYAQSEDAQPVVLQQPVIKNNSDVSIPRNIVSTNKSQQSQQFLKENNSLENGESIISVKQNNITNNIQNKIDIHVSKKQDKIVEKLNTSGSQIVADPPMPIIFENPQVVIPEFDRINSIRKIYPAKYEYNDFMPQNIIYNKFVPIRSKPEKPKYARNELTIYGDYGTARFDLFNMLTGGMDTKKLHTRGFGVSYNLKLSSRWSVGMDASTMSYHIVDGITGLQTKRDTIIHNYPALEMNLNTGKIETVDKKDYSIFITNKSYYIESNTRVIQQSLAWSINYTILRNAKFEMGIGVIDRLNYYYSLSNIGYADSGYQLPQGVQTIMNYNSYSTRYNTLGVSLNAKYKLYKGIYIQYQPMLLTNTSISNNNFHPQYLWNNRLGISYKW